MPKGVIDFEALAIVEPLAQRLGRLVDRVLAEGGIEWNFVLMCLEHEGAGSTYVCNCDRGPLAEILERVGRRLEENPTPDGVKTATVIGTTDPGEIAGAITVEQATHLATYTEPLQDVILEQLPSGWGFQLICFAPSPGRSTHYVATVAREGGAKALRELAGVVRQHGDRPRGRLGKDS